MATDIGSELKRLRESKGWSIGQAVAYCGVSNATISRIERGIRRPEPKTLQKLADGYNADMNELMILAGHMKADIGSPQKRIPARKALDAFLAGLGIPPSRREWWVSGIMQEADPLVGDERRRRLAPA